jgi:DNA-binding transcriptional MerR regulator
MPTSHPTKPASDKLQVSANTLRNWSEQYSDFLSLGARPGSKPERRFTEHDLTVLTYVKQLRSEGLERPAIIERLNETTFENVELLEATLQQTTELAPPALPEAPHAMPAVLVVVDAIEKRVNALEQSRQATGQGQRDYVQGIAIGAIGMLLFMLFLLLLFLLRRYL